MHSRSFVFLVVGLIAMIFFKSDFAEAQIKKNFKSSVKSPSELVSQSVSDDPRVADLAIRLLRAKGPKSVNFFLREYGGSVGNKRFERINTVFDMICQQHNCHSSQIFWHREFDEAMAYAELTKRPILALHLVGKLTDELSSFDSRMFRSLFYADQEISKYLRENFVMYWKSDRNVPKVEIDFGDGRKITQTAAGHAAHYVTNFKGEVIGALPGLYTPKYFLSFLKRMRKLSNSMRRLEKGERQKAIRDFHELRLSQMNKYWDRLNTKLKNKRPVALPAYLSPKANTRPVDGRVAVDQSSARSGAEAAVINSVVPEMGAHHRRFRISRELDERFDVIASKIQGDVKLSKSVLGYISSKYVSGTPLDRKISRLRISLAKDTLYNQYIYERNIHNWMRYGDWSFKMNAISESVRNSLFLSPTQDPWQGLWDGDVYSGLTNDGLNVIERSKPTTNSN